MGSLLVQNLIKDLEKDNRNTLKRKEVEQLLISLLAEYNILVSKSEIKEIVSGCVSEDNSLTIENFKLLLVRSLPKGT